MDVIVCKCLFILVAAIYEFAAINFDTSLMQKIFFFLFLLFLVGCKGRAKQMPTSLSHDTSIHPMTKHDILPTTKFIGEEERKQRRMEIEEQERNDSIQLWKALNKGLVYATKNKEKNSFQYKFEMLTDNSSIKVQTNLSYGHLFSKDKKHLIVRRTVPWGVISSIFILEKNNLKKVCEIEPLANTFIDDTVRDINGDSYKDFLVHTYSTSGCCRRDVYSAFLYFPKTGRFTSDYRFMNPTFSPNEKLIRGVEYGHPGEVGLYKYKWNGFRVDTIEFIYPYHDKKGQFIKTTKQEYLPTKNEGAVLKSLPNEYQKIESIEWFLDY
jgi:hypothetical protein